MNDVNLNPETQTDVSKLEVLISRQQLQKRIRELGQKISADYKNKELDLVGVLKGGFIFLADLVRELEIPCRIHFLQASSYQDRKTSSGVVRLSHDLQLTGKQASDDLEASGLICNKNSVPGETQPPQITSGLRFGVSAGTTRGFQEKEFTMIGEWISEVLKILSKGKKMKMISTSINGKVLELTREFLFFLRRTFRP